MNNGFLENIIKRIVDLPNLTPKWTDVEYIRRSIMRIIYEELKPTISNAVIIWNNQINSSEIPIIEDEFYPHSFKYDSYLKDSITQIEECIYPINGNDAFIKYKNYFKPEIAWWHSVWAFPIFDIYSKSTTVIIFLSSHSDILLSKEQIDFLHKIINEIYNNKISYQQNIVFDFIEQLSDFTRIKRKNKTLFNKYENLSIALEKNKHNIVHFSIWKIDDISKIDFNVIKEKSQNFENIPQSEKQNYRLKSSDSHRIINYVKFLKQAGIIDELKKEGKSELSKFIKVEVFSENDINEKYCLTEQYSKNIGMKINKTIIMYIPIIPMRHNMKTDKTNILCLYINNLQNTIFNNLVTISMLSRKIYESLTLHNQLITNDTTKDILEIQGKDEKFFYNKTANILKKRNECADCYIYMKEKMEDCLRMIIGIEDGNTIDEKMLEDEEIYSTDDNLKISLPLSTKLSNDSEFSKFIHDRIIEISSSKKWDNYYLYYGEYPKQSNSVYSAILIPIKERDSDNKKDFVGFALFINKNVSNGQMGEKYSPYFSAHNELIVSPSIESIYRYKLLRDAIKKKESLLGRIRHEIPHEVNLVTKNAQIIKKYFEDKINNVSNDEERSTYAHKMNEINQLLLSSERIGLYTIFATSINFTKQDILKNQEFLDFNVFLHSMESIFKTDAKAHGVDIKFDDIDANYKCRVSKLYKLAIINIIFNAIRYSRFGTWITIYIGKGIIKVENYGIGIKEEERKKIYIEGYRSKEAKEFTDDGMGFGLFLAKKVIESHNNHYLTHTSDYICKHNYAGIKAFYDFADERRNGLELFNNNYKNKYSWDDYLIKRSELENIIPIDYHYRAIPFNHISNFVINEFKRASIPFDEFERLFFNVNVYKTTFEIKFFN